MNDFFNQRRRRAPFLEDAGSWRSAKRIAAAVEQMVRDIRPMKKLAESGLIDAVVRAVGAASAEHLRVAGLRGGELVVEVDSSARLQEMEFRKRDILKALQRDADAPRVVRMKLKLGRWKKT